jgi:hypothetical protein
VPLVDLHAITSADAEHAGDEAWADLSPCDDKGQIDRVHLDFKGSEVVARLLVEALRKAVPELNDYFVSSRYLKRQFCSAKAMMFAPPAMAMCCLPSNM